MFLAVCIQCRHLLLMHRGLHCPPRMHPMTCEPSTSSVCGCARARLLRPLLCPLLQRGTFRRPLHVSRKTELSSSSTVRPLARLLLPLLSPLLRRGTLPRLSHVRCKTELGSSATVRTLLLLWLLCRTGKWGSRMTTRHFLKQPTRDMLLQSSPWRCYSLLLFTTLLRDEHYTCDEMSTAMWN
jgi:hypothetical protein